MKKKLYLICAVLILLASSHKNLYAQITLEHIYPGTAQYFYLVHLQQNGDKYVNCYFPVDEDSTCYFGQSWWMKFYDLNHSLWKNIDLTNLPRFPADPGWSCSSYAILYISDSLFNSDPLVEFLFTSLQRKANFINVFHTLVFNENLVQLFSDTTGPWYRSATIPQFNFPIYNTSQGTKMILYKNDFTAESRVYSLPGQLPTSIESQVFNSNTPQFSEVNLYPNPATEYTTVDYELPNDVDIAEFVFYDFNGKKIKSFKVDHSFKNLVLTTRDLPSGIYWCQLETAKGPIASKKFVKIK